MGKTQPRPRRAHRLTLKGDVYTFEVMPASDAIDYMTAPAFRAFMAGDVAAAVPMFITLLLYVKRNGRRLTGRSRFKADTLLPVIQRAFEINFGAFA